MTVCAAETAICDGAPAMAGLTFVAAEVRPVAEAVNAPENHQGPGSRRGPGFRLDWQFVLPVSETSWTIPDYWLTTKVFGPLYVAPVTPVTVMVTVLASFAPQADGVVKVTVTSPLASVTPVAVAVPTSVTVPVPE